MSDKPKQKLKLLMLMKILSEETDDDHPLTANQICQALNNKNIKAERKSIYNDIKALITYGIDINRSYKPNQGFYIASRIFELPEVRLLTDAVLAAQFITPKKTKDLIDKLSSLISKSQAEEIKKHTYIDDFMKFINEEIYYNIDAVQTALSKNKRIKFIYHHRKIEDRNVVFDEGKSYEVSPYALVWSKDKYYIVGNDQRYNNLSNYRIDKIKSICVTDKSIRPIKEFSDFETDFCTSDYLSRTVNMFCGEQISMEIICDKNFLEVIIDNFGENITLTNNGDDRFVAIIDVYISKGLVDWLIQNGDRVYVKSPMKLRQKVIERIKILSDNYLNDYSDRYL